MKHERCYLHCQESEVSKLLIETANLSLIHPGLVLCGRLKTNIYRTFKSKIFPVH